MAELFFLQRKLPLSSQFADSPRRLRKMQFVRRSRLMATAGLFYVGKSLFSRKYLRHA